MPLLKKYFAELPVFMLTCVLVGFAFTISGLSVRDQRFQALFFQNATMALVIGLCAFTAGFISYHRLRQQDVSGFYLKSLRISLFGGIVGRTFAVFVHQSISENLPLAGLDLILSYIPALMMTFLIATGYIFYWYHTEPARKAGESSDTIEIRSEGKLRYLQVRSICYLTAHGKRTIIHTEVGDYTVNMLLKEFLRQFPVPGLMRSHKKHAVQTRVIDYLRHNHSGEYLAGLVGDAFIVPVSPRFLPQIRRAKIG
jgi:uncharacterized membrane protein